MNFSKPKFWDKNKASFFAILLFPVTLIIKILFFLKKILTKQYQFSIPVICVGNIYIGGTGKTPMSIEIFSILKQLNMNPVFIRKEYDNFQDEFKLQSQTGPVFQNKKRVKAIENAINNKANVVVLDDGFQDFSVKKNFSIICFNEKQLIGNGFTIPSGPLREGLSSIKRANCVIINGEKNNNFENIILKENKNIKIFYIKYNLKNVNKFKNKKVVAFAGIGNPENFFNLLESYKINVIKKLKFSDHHNYTDDEMKMLNNLIKDSDSILLTTEKDCLRIKNEYKKNINFVKVEVEIKNKNKFIEEIKKIL